MPTLETLEHVKDAERMKSALKKARGSKAGGRFVFVFSSAALDGGPALLLGDPGRPVPKALIKQVTAGGKPVKGRYSTEEKRLIFFPAKEVNKTRMEKAIIKVMSGALKPGKFEVRLPSEVSDQEEAEALKQEETVEGMGQEETRRRSLAGILGVGKKKIGDKKDKVDDKKSARQTLIGMLKAGASSTVQVTLTPLPEKLQDIDESDTSPLGKAMLAARDAALAAQTAEQDLARATDARRKLVLALEAGMVESSLSDRATTRAQELLDDYDRTIARAEQVRAQSRAQQELLRLQEHRSLQEEWSAGDQERLAAAEKAVKDSQAALTQLDEESTSILADRKQEAERIEALELQRKDCWDAFNEADVALGEEQAALKDAQARLTKLVGSSKSSAADIDDAKAEIQKLVETCQRRKEQLEALDQRSDALEAKLKPRQARTRALIKDTAAVSLKQARQETTLAASEINAAQKRQDGFKRQREEIQEMLQIALNGRGGIDTTSINEDEEAALELDEKLAEALEERDAVLKARQALSSQILLLQAQGKDTDLEPKARRERTEKLQTLRGEILALEPQLHKKHKNLSKLTQEQGAVNKRLRDARTEVLRVAAEDPSFSGYVEKLEIIEDGLRTAEQDQIDATTRLEQCRDQEADLEREQKLEEGMNNALKLFEKNPQLTLFQRMSDPKKIQDAITAMDRRTAEENDRRKEEGEEEGEQLIVETVEAFINQIEELKAAGATMAQLRQVWDHFPRVLIPDSYRKELDNWRLMEEQLAAELAAQAEKERQAGTTGKVLKAVDIGRTMGDGLISLGGTAGSVAFSKGSSVEKLKALNSNITSVSKVADTLFQTGKITEAIPVNMMPQIAAITAMSSIVAQGAKLLHQTTLKKGGVLEASNKKEEGSPDPIKQLILEEDLLNAVQTLIEDSVKAGLSMAGTVVPFLSAAVSTADGFKQLVEMARRIYNAEQDRKLAQKAKTLDSSLTSSVKQSQTNEALKASEAAFSALGQFIQAAGQTTSSIGTFTAAGDMGATKTAGTVVSVVGMTVLDGTQAVVTVKNWALAVASEVMVRKARGGDTKAQQEIFRHSGKYAKGLIAIMARRNDPVALSYIKSRGLTPQMVEKSSPEIIRLYLLRRSEEDNFGEGPVENIKAAMSFLKTVGGGVLSVVTFIPVKITDYQARLKKADLESVGSADLVYELAPLHESIDELTSCRGMLTLIPEDAPQYIEASDMIHTWEDGLRATRQPIVKSIKSLEEKISVTASIILGLQKEVESSSDKDKRKAAEKSLRRAEEITATLRAQADGYWKVLDRMAPLV